MEALDPGYSAGLRFTRIDRTDCSELFIRLAGLPLPTPARPVPVDYAETVRRITIAR